MALITARWGMSARASQSKEGRSQIMPYRGVARQRPEIAPGLQKDGRPPPTFVR